jgi:serine/threonine protein kinase
MDAET